jgi:phenylalanyl-tRNA synthetase alpha subunit
VKQGLDGEVRLGDAWCEIIGCGMLTRETLRKAGYDPHEVSGFAWGLGLERLVVLKLGLDDIRKLWQPPFVPEGKKTLARRVAP